MARETGEFFNGAAHRILEQPARGLGDLLGRGCSTGGVRLMLAYLTAILVSCWATLKAAVSPPRANLSLWVGLIFSLNLATPAVTFN